MLKGDSFTLPAEVVAFPDAGEQLDTRFFPMPVRSQAGINVPRYVACPRFPPSITVLVLCAAPAVPPVKFALRRTGALRTSS